MRRIKLFASLTGAALLAGSMLCGAGCSEPAAAGKADTTLDPATTATIKLGISTQNQEGKIAQNLIASFNEKYPNITVETVSMSGSNTVNDIDRLHSTGQAPDIFLCNSFDMLTLNGMELLYDFSEVIADEIEAGTFSYDDYYETYFKMGQADFNGAQLMIPRSADRVVVHYDKKIIKDAEAETGLDILSHIHNGWTWDEFDQVCDMLKQYSVFQQPNRYLVDSYCEWEAVFYPIFRHFGVQIFAPEKNGQLTFVSDEAHQALDFIKAWADKGYIGHGGVEANFRNENGGVMLFQSQAVSEVETLLSLNKYPVRTSEEPMSDYYDVVTMPVFEGDEYIGAGPSGYCAYYGNKNATVVWAFMKHIISKEGQNAIADAGVNLVPVRKDMADYQDPSNHWGIGYTDYNLAAYTYEPDWNCYTDYFIKSGYSEFATALNLKFGQVIKEYAGGKSYEAVTGNLDKEIKTILQKK